MLNYFETIEKSSAYNIVKRDCEQDRLSHAYLFVSEDENLLKAFSENICKLLINKDSDNVQKNNLRIEKHNHPDVKFLAEEKALDAKSVSQIVDETDYRPFESDKKIFVVFNFQDMNESAQNKILKTVEEPPKDTYFIFLATSTNKILQTIKSRVKEIRLESISKDDIVSMLVRHNITQDKAEIFASCSAGNATLAENFALNMGFVDFFKIIIEILEKLDGSKDVLKYSVVCNDKKFDKNEFFNIVIMLLRDVLVLKSNQEDLLVNKNITNNLKIIAKKLNTESILELIAKANKCKEMLNFNVNSTSVVDEFLYKLAEVKVVCRRL